MKLRAENNPELAIKIMQAAGHRMATLGKATPHSWQEKYLNMEYIVDDLNVSPDEFIVLYLDDKPIAAAILQKYDKTHWANWPTEKPAVYGYKYAGNPEYPIAKTKIVFDAMKQYAAQIGRPVVRIDISDYEGAKLRLYQSQGFRQVGVARDTDSPETYLLLEYDPAYAR